MTEDSEKKGFDISASIGYVTHTPGEVFQSTPHRADENMYKIKTEYYEGTGKTRRE